MRLYKVREAAVWVDPFGDRHSHQTKYVRVLEHVEVVKTDEFKMFDNGYTDPYEVYVWVADDGRKWLALDNRVDYWGGTWYRPLFDEPRDPALDAHEIGPRVTWLTEKEMQSKRCVNLDGRAVDIEGNPL